jgi:precorrin-6B C5,15-methyltransferase / cobalt-precorrin-6B C5,C15-methyltransferase
VSAEITSWLSIVGLGADGAAGLSQAARRAVQDAACVFGSARQLALVASLSPRAPLPWPTPFSVQPVLARRGRATCVLASGDPFFYGVGSTLAPQLTPGEFVCFPAPSSLSLAAARLGWALTDLEIVSLHGRELTLIVPALQPGRRVLALSWDRRTPALLAALLCERGFGGSRLHVLEELGSPAERLRSARASGFDLSDVRDLNLVAIELEAEPHALYLPMRGSLPDSAFEHDGQLTKQDVRALTMTALAPRAGALLWDVGAGAGSIGIEWLLAHPACRAIAVERDAARCERIARNARSLGVPRLVIEHAQAPAGLAALPAPDAVFIGGGVGDAAIFERCLAALAPGGRLVMNAVSLESEALLLRLFGVHGGELLRFSLDKAAPLGTLNGWRRALPVTQWRLTKA